MMNPDMLYVISPEEQNRETLTEILTAHPEIKFVSFMGVDFAGNDTDEKVPISLFLKDIDGFLEGMAAQTDGSSVVLTGIATLNNARVDMKIDSSVNWYIDYNSIPPPAEWLARCVFRASLYTITYALTPALFCTIRWTMLKKNCWSSLKSIRRLQVWNISAVKTLKKLFSPAQPNWNSG